MSGRAAIRRGLALRRPKRRSISIAPRLRRRLLAILALMAVVTAGYVFWLRDSSLVEVKDVQVTGVSGRDAPDVRRALESVAGDMTTLHVRRDALAGAVRRFPVVADLRLSTDFPHGLRIRVVQRQPAAVVEAGGARAVVAGDGTILPAADAPSGLPTIRASSRAGGRRLTDSGALAAARVAGGAPAPLDGRLTQVRHTADRGYVVVLKDGPDLVFGEAARVQAKWIAATRVLADEHSKGATYIDLRIPERPAAGGLAPEALDSGPQTQSDGAGDGAAATPSPPTGPGSAQTPPQSAPATPTPTQAQPPAAPGEGDGTTSGANPQP